MLNNEVLWMRYMSMLIPLLRVFMSVFFSFARHLS